MFSVKNICLALSLLGVACSVQAEQLPRWELGVGTAAFSMPSYRGADDHKGYAWIFPYGAYRLDWLKVDRRGMKARLFDSERVELNMSVSASPPVRGNAAREGMPDLKPLVEFGPSLDFNLWNSAARDIKLDLLLPARMASTVSSHPTSAGWSFAPSLNLDIVNLGRSGYSNQGWRLGLMAGPMFASERQNAYLYSVAPQYAQVNRPSYNAQGGYAGMKFLAAVSRRYGDTWFGAFVRVDSLHGAAFEDSPLVKRSSYAAAGFALTHIIKKSAEMVEQESD